MLVGCIPVDPQCTPVSKFLADAHGIADRVCVLARELGQDSGIKGMLAVLRHHHEDKGGDKDMADVIQFAKTRRRYLKQVKKHVDNADGHPVDAVWARLVHRQLCDPAWAFVIHNLCAYHPRFERLEAQIVSALNRCQSYMDFHMQSYKDACEAVRRLVGDGVFALTETCPTWPGDDRIARIFEEVLRDYIDSDCGRELVDSVMGRGLF